MFIFIIIACKQWREGSDRELQQWILDFSWIIHFTDYNFHIVNRDVTKRSHPEAVCPFIPEIASFARHNHFNILHPILRYASGLRNSLALNVYSRLTRLVARGLELPEDTLVDTHKFDADGETYVRFMK